jgi:hypothetical protein
MRKLALMLGLSLGMSLAAKAGLDDPILLEDAGPQATTAIEETVSDELGMDVVALLRYDARRDLEGPPFTIEFESPGRRGAEVGWDLNNDEELFAIYVFAGGQAFLYLVHEDQRTFGEGEFVIGPETPAGRSPAIGRIVFLGLGERRPEVPAEVADGGLTLALLGLSMTGMAFIRRRLVKS